MIANMNEKGRQTKLLAAIAILAMVVCVFAVALPAEDVNGDTPTQVTITSAPTDDFTVASGGVYYISVPMQITAADVATAAKIYLAPNIDVTIVGYSSADAITVNAVRGTFNAAATPTEGSNVGTLYADSSFSVNITAGAGETYTVSANSVGTDDSIAISTAVDVDNQITVTKTDVNDTVSITVTTEKTVDADAQLGIANATINYTAGITAVQAASATGNDITFVTNSKVVGNITIEELSEGKADGDVVEITGDGAYSGTITYGSSYVTGTNIDATITATNNTTADMFVMTDLQGGTGYSQSGLDTSDIKTITTATSLDITGLGLDTSAITSVTATSAPFTGSITRTGTNAFQLSTSGFEGKLTLTSGSAPVVTTFTAGTLSLISGDFTYTPTSIEQGASLNVLTNADMKITALTVGTKGGNATDGTATLNLYGVLKADSDVVVTVTDNGRLVALQGAALDKVTLKSEGTGVLNTTGAMEDVIIDSGSLNSTGAYSQFQNVIINTTLTISRPANVTILGKLTVNPGVTVYVSNGATLTIGNNSVPADLDVQGTIDVTGELDVNSNEMKISNGGAINVQSEGTLTVTSGTLSVGTGSNLNIYGTIAFNAASLYIANSGTITFSEATLGGTQNPAIDLVSAGATVNVQSVTGAANKTLTISDKNIDDRNVTSSSNNSVVLEITNAGDVVSGLTATETVTYVTENGERAYTNNMVLSGNIVVSNATTVAAAQDVATVTGKSVIVSESLNLGEFVKMNIDTGANFVVSGDMNIVSNASLYGAGTVTVTGQIVAAAQVYNTTTTDGIADMNAAEYKVLANGTTTWYYTTLNNAVNAGQNAVTVYGDITVSEDMTIPSPVTVTINANGTITVSEGATMTIANGAKIRNGDVYVEGTVIAEKYRDSNTVFHSDVQTINGDTAEYTNIYNALNNAEEGSTVVITRSPDAVVIDRDVEIRSGVTLQVDAAKVIEVIDDVTVTVNGTLFVNGGSISAAHMFGPEADDEVSGLVVNGIYKSLNPVEYTADSFEVAGAYYYMVDSTGSYDYIAPLDYAVGFIQSTDGIEVYGENSVDDITVTGTTDGDETVTVIGELTAGTITLSQAKLVIGTAAQFDGTVASDAGSIELVNIRNVTVAADVDNETPRLLLSGTPVQADTTANADDAAVTIASGDVTVNANLDFTAAGAADFAIDGSAAATVTGANVLMKLGTAATIDGELVVTNNANVQADTMVVFGTFTVAAAGAENDAGTASIDNLYVGITSDISAKYVEVSQTAAAVNGNISGLDAVYVGAQATVPAQLVQGMKHTAYYIEDALFVTVYANTGVNINDVYTPLVDAALVQNWQYTNSDGVLTNVENNSAIGIYENVYGKMKYDVYELNFTIEYGITDVYVDDVLVATAGLSGNTEVEPYYVTAGEHTITYRLNNYFAGDVRITLNGEALTNGEFTITEDMPFYDENGFISYDIVLTGVEAAAPENPATPSGDSGSSDDGLGLTDYLLIVLVILIVIMAIMVAVRLMRS